MCLLQYYQVVYKTIIQNKISLKCRSWANTIPPAAIKVVFFSSFRIKVERMIFTRKHWWFRRHLFIWSEKRKQRRSRAFLIVHWLLALVDLWNTNSPSFCPFTQFSHSIHSVIYLFCWRLSWEYISIYNSCENRSSNQEVSNFWQLLPIIAVILKTVCLVLTG